MCCIGRWDLRSLAHHTPGAVEDQTTGIGSIVVYHTGARKGEPVCLWVVYILAFVAVVAVLVAVLAVVLVAVLVVDGAYIVVIAVVIIIANVGVCAIFSVVVAPVAVTFMVAGTVKGFVSGI